MSIEVSVTMRKGPFDLQVSFETEGGITSLFGPSGAGKTTILRCVAGLDRPDHGRIAIDSQLLFDSEKRVDLPSRRRRIGYVFQEYALFPHLTVERNVTFGMAEPSSGDRRERCEELLRKVGLGGLGERRPNELSGGQRQRVALARALAGDPQLLLLDEPFAAVDLRVRRKLREEIVALQRETGIPMLFVTHDLHEVQQMADRVVILDHGRVVRDSAIGSFQPQSLAELEAFFEI